MMDKRFFIAIIITILFLIGYQTFIAKYYPQKQTPVTEEVQVPAQSVPSIETTPTKADLFLEGEIIETKEAAPLPQAQIGNFIVTYSTRGGYIKSVKWEAFDDALLFQNIGYIPQDKDKNFTAAIKRDRISFASNDGSKKEFIIQGNTITIKLTRPTSSIILFYNPLDTNSLGQRYQEFFYSKDDTVLRESVSKVKDNNISAVEFAGSRNRYYCISLLKGTYNIQTLKKDKNAYLILSEPTREIALYVGPQRVEDLEPFGLQSIVSYGKINPIAHAIIKLLYFFYSFTKNWGIAIILFSIAAYLVLFPLTLKSSKGMKEMKDFQRLHKGEIDKIKEKYKDNQHKIHEATMEIYKKYGFNPLKGCASGCLPMFFQIPLIWAFWSVTPRAWMFKNAGFLWIKDLSLPDKAMHLPFTLPFGLGDWLNILPVLTAIAMFLQMKYANPHMDPEQEQQQKMMAFIFPIMIGWFTYNLPSALLLYWFTNSILTFVSQWKIMRSKNNTAVATA